MANAQLQHVWRMPVAGKHRHSGILINDTYAMQETKFPKALVHEFYQTVNAVPIYHVEAIEPVNGELRFRAYLTCPAVNGRDKAFPESVFEGEGRNKREAQHKVSLNAIEALVASGVATRLQLPGQPVEENGPPHVNNVEVGTLIQRFTVLNCQMEVENLDIQARKPKPVADELEGADLAALDPEVALQKLRVARKELADLSLEVDLNDSQARLAHDVLNGHDIIP
jgi:hypothetical protein